VSTLISPVYVNTAASHQWQSYTTPVRQVMINKASTCVIAVIGRALRVWGITHGELRLVVQMSSRQTMTVSDLARHELLCCAATPDGNCIVAAGDVTGKSLSII
jgi:hypothetical protein